MRAAGHTPLADMLSVQAGVLADELDRLCGTNSSGQAPAGCSHTDVTPTQAPEQSSSQDLSPVITQAQQATVKALATAESPSVDRGLLVGVFAGLAVIAAQSEFGTFPYPMDSEGPVDSVDSEGRADTSPRKKTVEAVSQLLAVEHQVIYGLGVAQAYTTGSAYSAVSAMADKHRLRRDQLAQWLTSTGGLTREQLPQAEAGYQFSTQPTDPASGLNFAVDAEFMAISEAYRSAQTLTGPSQLGLLLADFMQEAAVDAAYCVRLAGGNPLSDGRFTIPGRSA